MVAQLLSRNRRLSIKRNFNTNNLNDGMLSADELAKGVPVQMFTFFQLLVLVQIFSHS
jgi:hypothetical protein